ncbi:hypothetical protein [Kitasatospora purpeofusca]|uniref:hypothetical protein n=1 Tax=Kitasatospora purpeofusca TaxID=67352 RepID=UPI0036D28975
MVAAVGGLLALTTPLGHHPVGATALFTRLGFFGIGGYGPWVAHPAEAAPPGAPAWPSACSATRPAATPPGPSSPPPPP